MEFNPITLNMLRFNEEYRSSLDGNFKQASAVINELNRQIDLNKKRLEAALLNPTGGGNPEVVAARVAEDGTTHATLYDHIAAIEQNIEANELALESLTTYQNDLKTSIDMRRGVNINLYVNGTTGLDTNDGSELTPFKTIQKAIDSIPLFRIDGTTNIYIADGTYTEDLVLKNRFGGGIYLVGNLNVPTNLKINSIACADIYAYLNVTGFQAISAIKDGFKYDRCTYVNTTKAVNTVTNKPYNGIFYSASNGVVVGSTVSNCAAGIFANFNSQLTIEEDNTGSGNEWGIRAGRSIIHKKGQHTITGTTANEGYYYGGIISNGGIIG